MFRKLMKEVIEAEAPRRGAGADKDEEKKSQVEEAERPKKDVDQSGVAAAEDKGPEPSITVMEHENVLTRLSELFEQIEHLSTRNSELEAKNGQLSVEVERLRLREDDEVVSRGTAETELDAMKMRPAELEQKSREMIVHEDLTLKLEDALEAVQERDQLLVRNSELSKAKSELTSQLGKLREETSAAKELESEVTVLRSRVFEFEALQLIPTVAMAEHEEVLVKLEEAQRTVQELNIVKEESKELCRKLFMFEKLQSDHKTQNEDIGRQVLFLKEHISELEKEIKSRDGQISELNSLAKEKDEKIKSKVAVIAELEQFQGDENIAKKELESEVEALKGRVSELEPLQFIPTVSLTEHEEVLKKLTEAERTVQEMVQLKAANDELSSKLSNFEEVQKKQSEDTVKIDEILHSKHELENVRNDLENEVKELKSKLVAFDEKASEPSIAMKEHESVLSKQLEEIEQLTRRRSELEVENGQLTAELNQVRLQVDEEAMTEQFSFRRECDETIAKLEDSVAETVRERDQLLSRNAELSYDLNELRQREENEEALELELEALKKKLAEQESSNSRTVPLEVFEDAKTKLDTALKVVSERDELLVRNAELFAKVESLSKGEAANERTTKELQLKLEELDQVSKAKSDLASQLVELRNLHQELNENFVQLERTRSEETSASKELESEVHVLRSRVSELETLQLIPTVALTEHEDVLARLAEAQRTVQELDKVKEELCRKLSTFEKVQSDQKTQNEDIGRQVLFLKEHISELEKEIKSRDGQISELNSLAKGKDEKIKSNMVAMAELEQFRSEENIARKDLEAEVEGLRGRVSELEPLQFIPTVSLSEHEEVLKRLAEAERTVQETVELKAQKDELMSKVSNFEKVQKDQKSQSEDTERQLAFLKEHTSELEAHIKSRDVRIADLSSISDEKAELARTNENLSCRVEQLNSQVSKSLSDCGDFKKELENSQKKISDLEARLALPTVPKAQFEAVSKKFGEQVAKLEKEKDKFSTRNGDMSRKIEEILQSKHELQSVRDGLKKEVEQLRSKVAAAEEKDREPSITMREHESVLSKRLEEIGHLTRRSSELEAKNGHLSVEVERLRQREDDELVSRDALETELDAMKMRLAELEQSSRVLTVPLNVHEDLTLKLEDALEAVQERDQLLVRNAELSQKVESDTKRKADDEVDRRDLQDELEGLKNKVIGLERNGHGPKSSPDSVERKEHEAAVARLEETIADKNKTIRLQQQRISDIKKSLQKGDFVGMSNSKNEAVKNSSGYWSDSGNDIVPEASPLPLRKASNSSGKAGSSSSGDPLNKINHDREINFQYLKNVVFKFITNGDHEAQKHLVKAISVLLEFTDAEERTVRETVDWRASWLAGLPLVGQTRRPALGSSSGSAALSTYANHRT